MWRRFLYLFNFKDYEIEYDFEFATKGHITFLHLRFQQSQCHLYTMVNGSRFYSTKEFIYIIPPNAFDLNISFTGKNGIKKVQLAIPQYFKTSVYLNSANNLNFPELQGYKLKNQLNYFLSDGSSTIRKDRIEIPEIKMGYYRQTSKIIRKNRVVLKNYNPQFKKL